MTLTVRVVLEKFQKALFAAGIKGGSNDNHDVALPSVVPAIVEFSNFLDSIHPRAKKIILGCRCLPNKIDLTLEGLLNELGSAKGYGCVDDASKNLGYILDNRANDDRLDLDVQNIIKSGLTWPSGETVEKSTEFDGSVLISGETAIVPSNNLPTGSNSVLSENAEAHENIKINPASAYRERVINNRNASSASFFSPADDNVVIEEKTYAITDRLHLKFEKDPSFGFKLALLQDENQIESLYLDEKVAKTIITNINNPEHLIAYLKTMGITTSIIAEHIEKDIKSGPTCTIS